jgi:Tfp pilus assembly protein PilF
MINEIPARVRERGYARPSEVRALRKLATETRSAATFVAVGHLIQLLEDVAEFQLSDAEAAYLSAIEIDPACADAYVSLGHFYDAVMDDPARAKPFFERAVALGDESARAALRAVIEQLTAG